MNCSKYIQYKGRTMKIVKMWENA